MLTLNRKIGQGINLMTNDGTSIMVYVTDTSRGSAKLTLHAPREVAISIPEKAPREIGHVVAVYEEPLNQNKFMGYATIVGVLGKDTFNVVFVGEDKVTKNVIIF